MGKEENTWQTSKLGMIKNLMIKIFNFEHFSFNVSIKKQRIWNFGWLFLYILLNPTFFWHQVTYRASEMTFHVIFIHVNRQKNVIGRIYDSSVLTEIPLNFHNSFRTYVELYRLSQRKPKIGTQQWCPLRRNISHYAPHRTAHLTITSTIQVTHHNYQNKTSRALYGKWTIHSFSIIFSF